jgi:hypothetical protein
LKFQSAQAVSQLAAAFKAEDKLASTRTQLKQLDVLFRSAQVIFALQPSRCSRPSGGHGVRDALRLLAAGFASKANANFQRGRPTGVHRSVLRHGRAVPSCPSAPPPATERALFVALPVGLIAALLPLADR